MSSAEKCWVWLDPNDKWRSLVHSYVSVPTKRTIILELSPIKETFNDSQTIQFFILGHCRQNGLFKNFQTSFLNTKDHLLALQLALTRASKEVGGTVTLSDVMFCHKQYIKYSNDIDSIKKLSPLYRTAIASYVSFLTQSNAVNEWQMIKIFEEALKSSSIIQDQLKDLNFLLLGWPKNTIHEGMLKILLNKNDFSQIVLETPLDASTSENSEISDQAEIEILPITLDDFLPPKVNYTEHRVPATQIYVEDVIGAFLRLLINSRDELALAKALTSPLVNMNHDGFTLLKNQSSEKQMPMCQTVISYVTRIQLGGKGYAAPSNCPLKPYVKELTDFVELLQLLQNTIEEDFVPASATKKILNLLKKRFLKIDDIKSTTVLIAIEKMDAIMSAIPALKVDVSMSKILNAKTLALLGYLSDQICCWNFYEDNLALLRTPGSSSQRTPLSVPSVLHFFRTPEIYEEDSMDKPLRERITQSIKITSKFQAGLPWGDNEVTTNLDYSSLSPILEVPFCSPTVNEPTETTTSLTPKRSKESKAKGEGRKRHILTDLTNQENKLKKLKVKAPKKIENSQ